MITLTWDHTKLAWRPISRAFAWWLAELSGLLPATLRLRLAGPPRPTLRLDFARESAVLVIPGHNRLPSASMSINLATQSPAWPVGAVAMNAPVRIYLDESFLFRPIVDLPLAAESALRSILSHQLERLVPLDPATLRFVWRVIERDRVKNRLKVEVTIVKQVTLDRALALARALSLMPQAVLIEQTGQPAESVWRGTAAGLVSSRERTFKRILEVVAICLILAAYVVFLTHLGARRTILNDLALDLQSRMQAVQALSARAATAEKTLAEVNARLAPPSALSVLDALTRALPLGSSVSEFYLQGDKVEISGVASHATALLATIDQERLFEDSSFTAPIVAAGERGGERYQLVFHITGTKP